MKVGDKVKIRTGRRGKPPQGEVVDIIPAGDPQNPAQVLEPRARVSRKGVGIEVYPIADLTVVEEK